MLDNGLTGQLTNQRPAFQGADKLMLLATILYLQHLQKGLVSTKQLLENITFKCYLRQFSKLFWVQNIPHSEALKLYI